MNKGLIFGIVAGVCLVLAGGTYLAFQFFSGEAIALKTLSRDELPSLAKSEGSPFTLNAPPTFDPEWLHTEDRTVVLVSVTKARDGQPVSVKLNVPNRPATALILASAEGVDWFFPSGLPDYVKAVFLAPAKGTSHVIDLPEGKPLYQARLPDFYIPDIIPECTGKVAEFTCKGLIQESKGEVTEFERADRAAAVLLNRQLYGLTVEPTSSDIVAPSVVLEGERRTKIANALGEIRENVRRAVELHGRQEGFAVRYVSDRRDVLQGLMVRVGASAKRQDYVISSAPRVVVVSVKGGPGAGARYDPNLVASHYGAYVTNRNGRIGRVTVEVGKSSEKRLLVLTSDEPVDWNVSMAKGANLMGTLVYDEAEIPQVTVSDFYPTVTVRSPDFSPEVKTYFGWLDTEAEKNALKKELGADRPFEFIVEERPATVKVK